MNKEVTIAVISGAAVIIAAVISGYFLLKSQTDDNPSPSTKDRLSRVDVAITAALHDEQYHIKQDLTVEIDGEHKGDLSIETGVEPEDTMPVSLLAPKSHSYEIGGITIITLANGNFIRHAVFGKGEITVLDEENQTFDITFLGQEGDKYIVELK